MKLPAHIGLTIEHNPHAVLYQPLVEWLEINVDTLDAVDVEPVDRAEILSTGSLWVITWYPNSPVGHCAVAAATLERAVELANDPERT